MYPIIIYMLFQLFFLCLAIFSDNELIFPLHEFMSKSRRPLSAVKPLPLAIVGPYTTMSCFEHGG